MGLLQLSCDFIAIVIKNVSRGAGDGKEPIVPNNGKVFSRQIMDVNFDGWSGAHKLRGNLVLPVDAIRCRHTFGDRVKLREGF